MTVSLPTQATETLSPYSVQVLDTLRNILAPGKRFKISPHIEAVQFYCLFGETLDPAIRNQQMHEVIRQHDARLEELAQKHSEFASTTKNFVGAYNREFLDSYMIYYFPVNVAKLQLMMLELLEREKIESEIRVIDIGVGSGTSALAFFDFLLAWGTVCELYDVEFPISSVSYTGVDNSRFCLEYAKNAVEAYGQRVQARTGATGNQLLGRLGEWLRFCEWIQKDLNTEDDQIAVDSRQTLVIASNVLNELSPQGRKKIEQLFIGAPEGSLGLFIEPGDRTKTTRLNTWRKNLQIKNNQVQTVAPCGQEHEDFLKCKCDYCWSARRESLFQTPLYSAFRQKASKYITDKRAKSFDDYQNDLLSWSYYILKNGKRKVEDIPVNLAEGHIRRFIGSFVKGKPAMFLQGDSITTEGVEKLKFCPGIGAKYSKLEITRQPGMQLPDLQHGEWVDLKSVKKSTWDMVDGEDGQELQITPDEIAMFDLVPVGRSPKENVFLSSYSGRVKFAVDELAFRLFGFPSMRPFQHGILERVLQGGNILGIAATGGGKSECYILPAMLLPGITIVIAPLISLIQDQFEQRIQDRYGLDGVTTYINSEIPFKERQARLKRLTLGYYKIIYLTPEQLEKSYILNCLQEADRKYTIRYLALDESHCISQWGHDFRPAYLNMVTRLNLWEIKPTRIALTATASPEVRKDLCLELGLNPEPLEAGGDVYLHSSNRYELNFIARAFPSTAQKSEAIVEALKQLDLKNRRDKKDKGAAIVFLPYTGGNPEHTYFYLPDEQKKETPQKGMHSTGVTPFASFLERELQQRVSIYHGKIDNGKAEPAAIARKRILGDLSGRTRQTQQKGYIEGETDIMVSTKGFGMGIDKPNIRLVIHRTPTANLEAYAQEAGRAGRDGRIADCHLFYSPDSQNEGYGESAKVPSDHEIQTRFLSDKYIRVQDIIVLFHFLRSVDRKVGEYVYFTNDEVLDFIQAIIKDPGRVGLSEYSWPKLSVRDVGPYEKDEEKLILERGHNYQQQTNYINRVLSVAYRIRPIIQERRVSLLEELQETGAAFSSNKVQINNAAAIVNATNYFGTFFRDKGLDATGLYQWLEKCREIDFIEFCRFLDISIKELTGLLQDIKRAEGCFTQLGEWKPRLLNFNAIIPPKYGPAKGKNTLQQWRDYAGATKLKKKAYVDAKKELENGMRENSTPTIDERFPWDTMPFPKGWEVKLGNAFHDVMQFNVFLKAFMQVHDEREKNDWAAYYRLLSDYIGVDKEGNIREKDNRKCLRSVMLGYLKTYEVVQGGSCMSCNVCVPNEKFEIDLEKRKRVVVKLSEEIAEFIEHVEGTWQVLPEDDAIGFFWDSVQSEVAAGRSALGYIEGATGRMLDDNPAHIPALYIRLTGMATSIIAMDKQAFVDNARTLVTNCSVGDAERFLEIFWGKADQVLPENSDVLDVQALAFNKIGSYREEFVIRQHIHTSPHTSMALFDTNCQALCELIRPGGKLENHDQFMEYALELARSANTLETSHEYYQILLKNWSWKRVREELDWQGEDGKYSRSRLFVLERWLELNRDSTGCDDVYAFLEEENLVKGWPTLWESKLFADMRLEQLDDFPRVKCNYWQAAEMYGFRPAPSLYISIFTDFVHGRGEAISGKSAGVVIEILFNEFDEHQRVDYIENNIVKDASFIKKLLNYLKIELLPNAFQYFSGWLLLFIRHIDLYDFDITYKLIAKLLSCTSKQVQEIILQYHDLLEGVVVMLLASDEHRRGTHNLLLKYIEEKKDSDVLSFYLCCLLKSDSSKSEMLDESVGLLLKYFKDENVKVLTYVESVIPEGIELPDSILAQTLKFRSLIRSLKKDSDIGSFERLSPENFREISAIFKPDTSVNRADMVVSLLMILRDYLVPTWLTPVSYLIEALGCARRFDEAHQLASQYPDLKVGRSQIVVDTFLRILEKRNSDKREKTDSSIFFDQVARDEVRNWTLAKNRRR